MKLKRRPNTSWQTAHYCTHCYGMGGWDSRRYSRDDPPGFWWRHCNQCDGQGYQYFFHGRKKGTIPNPFLRA